MKTQNNAKALFDAYMHEANAVGSVNANLYKSLYIDRTSQTVDAIIFAAKSASASTSFDQLFATDDSLSVGTVNISNAQLPVNTYFMCTAISLQYGVAGGVLPQNVKETDFNLLPAEIRNGEFSLSMNKKPILEKTLCEIFDHADNYIAVGDTNAAAATPVTYTLQGRGDVCRYELNSPKMLLPQELLEVKLKFVKALAANAAVKIILHGATNVTA